MWRILGLLDFYNSKRSRPELLLFDVVMIVLLKSSCIFLDIFSRMITFLKFKKNPPDPAVSL